MKAAARRADGVWAKGGGFRVMTGRGREEGDRPQKPTEKPRLGRVSDPPEQALGAVGGPCLLILQVTAGCGAYAKTGKCRA